MQSAPPTESLLDDHLLASSNNPAILEQLQCPICLRILHQPLELPCRALVCTACMVQWFKVCNCSGIKCPCCFMDTAPQLKAATLLIQTLLMDIALQCQTCRKDIKACEYGTHTSAMVQPKAGKHMLAWRTQGAESIQARFKGLQRTYHSVPDKVLHLVLMVKEHLLSTAPQNVAATLLLPAMT